MGGLPTTSGRIWITNGVDQKTIEKTDTIPDGWKKGRLKATETAKRNMSKSHIGEINITDGVNERHIKSGESIPYGWRVGKSDKMKSKLSHSTKGRYNITNGSEMRHVRTLDNIPSGWRRGNVDVSEETRRKLSITSSSEHKKASEINTKRKNNSFCKSTPEEIYYNRLIEQYGRDDVFRQYRDERYPFNCDFYIKSKDMFIECNFHWTHGKHPYDSNSAED